MNYTVMQAVMQGKTFYRLMMALGFVIIMLSPVLLYSQPAQNRPTTQQQNTNLRQVALEFYADRQYEKAIELLEQLYDAEPSQSIYTYLLSSYFQIREYKKAEKLAKGQIKINRNANVSRYYCDLGYVYSSLDDSKKAEQEYTNALNNLKPNDGDVYSLANGFITYGLYDKAISTYNQGAKIIKAKGRFDNELAYLYELLGDSKQMVEFYLDYVSEDPTRINNIKYRLQNSINKETSSTAIVLRESLLKRLQRDPGNIAYAELLLWLSINQQDFDMAIRQAVSLDQRLSERGDRLFDLAKTAFNLNQYKHALTALNYILQKSDKTLFLMAKTLQLQARQRLLNPLMKEYTTDTDNIRKEYADIVTKYGYTTETAELIANYAQLETTLYHKLDKGIQLLESVIALPTLSPILKAQYKLQLADIYLFTDDVWEASLLYSQVEKTFKNEPIGHEAKFKNAKLTFYQQEFDWSKAQADVLKAATSKLIANDAMQLSLLISDNKDADSSYIALSYFADAELLFYKQKYADAEQKLDSIKIIYPRHPIDDDVLFKKYEIAIAKYDYTQADTLLATLYTGYQSGIYAHKAVFLRAVLNDEQLGNKDKANQLYLYIITKQPESLHLIEARKRYRNGIRP